MRKRWDGSRWLPSPTDFEYVFGPIVGIPAVVSRGGGRVDLVALLSDGSPVYYGWDGTQWLPEVPLGGRQVTALSATSWGPARLDIVGVNEAGVLQHKWFDGSNWGPSPTDWEAMGGAWVGGRPQIASTAANRLDLVINDGYGLIRHKEWDGTRWNPAVDQWSSLDRVMIGSLHETDVRSPHPLRQWRTVVPPVPMHAGRVMQIQVLPSQRRILSGCERGVWWSPIPPASARGVGYNWQQATGLPDRGFFGLAKGPGESVIAAAYGTDIPSGAYGLFRGDFSSGSLVMHRGLVAGVDARLMARTSVASCDRNPGVAYAVASDPWNYGYVEAPEVVSWGPNRLDIFARSLDSQPMHLVWDGTRWRAWEPLGGILSGPPRAASRGLNRLDVFGVGLDRGLYHKWWDGSQWHPSPTGWESLGGTVVGDPAVCALRGRNRVDVFVVGLDGALYHKYLDAAGWHPAVGYDRLGGILWGSPTAVWLNNGRMHVLCAGTDGALYHKVWDGSQWLPSHDGLEQLGTDQALYPVAIPSTRPGRVDVFAVGASGNVIHKAWDEVGMSWLPSHTTYDDLRGVFRGGPTAVTDGLNRIDVFARGTDDQIHVNTWIGSLGSWSDWVPQGGNMLGMPPVALTSYPKAVCWGPGRRDVFVTAPLPSPPPGENPSSLWQLWTADGPYRWTPQGGNLYPTIAGASIYTILRSDDGGLNWHECGLRVPADPNNSDMRIRGGNAGDYNNCISVKPTDSETVAVGWRGGLPNVSTDGGNTWTVYDMPFRHGDAHIVRFDSSGTRLYVGNDGGLVMTSDGGRTFTSSFNRTLFTFQFLMLSPSYQSNGLLVGALQDNGVVFCQVGTGRAWRELEDSDGVLALCIRTRQVLYSSNVLPQVQLASIHDGGLTGNGAVPLTVPKPGSSANANGLALRVINLVNSPRWANAASERMLAIGATGNDLYGAFGRPDGANLHWEYMGTVSVSNANISATNSGDGRTIFVGLDDGSIYSYDSASRSARQMRVLWPKDGPGSVRQIVMHNTRLAFAICNRGPNGHVLRWQGTVWMPLSHGLPVEPFYGLDTDWTIRPKPMYVATDSRVYVSTDNGESWQNVSDGLPIRGHLSELRFVVESNGAHYLYVSTWGRSVFRTRLN